MQPSVLSEGKFQYRGRCRMGAVAADPVRVAGGGVGARGNVR